MLSIVIPVYKSKDSIVPLFEEVSRTLTDSYELIFVDDASPTDDWSEISILAQRAPQVRALRLSRNFGQHAAILAGLTASKGDRIVVMDCDLQHDPKDIRLLINKADEGYDVVYTLSENRSHPTLKNFFASLWHGFFNLLSSREGLKRSVIWGHFP